MCVAFRVYRALKAERRLYVCIHVCTNQSLIRPLGGQPIGSKVLSLSGSLSPRCKPFKTQRWLLYVGIGGDRRPLSAAVTSGRPPQLERLQRERWHFVVSVTRFHSSSPFHLLFSVIMWSSSLSTLRFSAGYPHFLCTACLI